MLPLMCSLTLNLARNQSLAAAGDSDSQLEGPRFRDPLERDVQPRSSLQVRRESFLALLRSLLHPCKRGIVQGGVY